MKHCKKHNLNYRTSLCPVCLGECCTEIPHTGHPEQMERAKKRLEERENGSRK